MTARVFLVTLSVATRKALADRGALAFTGGFYVAVTLALGALWRTAAAANGGEVAGYGAVALVWYVAAAEASNLPLNARLIDDLAEDVRTGAVTVEMLRPASLLGVRVATEVGRALPRLALCCGLGVLLASLTAGAPPAPAALALAVPALLLAIGCNLVAMHVFAALAFWVRDARATWFLYQKLVFVVGGMLLPLEALPGPMADVARLLPFMAMAYAPARIASGHVEPYLLAVQALWLVLLVAAGSRVYALGERRVQVTG